MAFTKPTLDPQCISMRFERIFCPSGTGVDAVGGQHLSDIEAQLSRERTQRLPMRFAFLSRPGKHGGWARF
jgi:hypothetical protein